MSSKPEKKESVCAISWCNRDTFNAYEIAKEFYQLTLPGNFLQIVENIPRPIHQASVKQWIKTIAPNEVLHVVVTPESFRNLGFDFCRFSAIVRSFNQQNLMFYPTEKTQDAFIASQAYNKKHPNHMQVIGIEDPEDFFELAQKSGPGAAGKPKSGTDATIAGLDFSGFICTLGIPQRSICGMLRRPSYPWCSLDVYSVKRALDNIPKQEGSVECAANSAARALILCNIRVNIEASLASIWENDGYNSFRENCPQDIDTIAAERVVPTATELGMILAPFTGGFSLLAGTALALASSAVASSVSTGPSPWELSKYIDRHIPKGNEFKYSQVYFYDKFNNCAKTIASDIRADCPVIVFIFWGPTVWHYANVVAVKGSQERPDGFMLLETGCSFDYRVYDNLQHIMYNEYKFQTRFCMGGTPKNYTIIRFCR